MLPLASFKSNGHLSILVCRHWETKFWATIGVYLAPEIFVILAYCQSSSDRPLLASVPLVYPPTTSSLSLFYYWQGMASTVVRQLCHHHLPDFGLVFPTPPSPYPTTVRRIYQSIATRAFFVHPACRRIMSHTVRGVMTYLLMSYASNAETKNS